ncbi:lipoprotein insertase outer membrane protein LolB [Legionella sp. CNM-4043-24]|uniref:lipoprotein insertase outer membrane protein LolB n=1 Tax=Legionella sp. CNM-4043-24 TaxID=3421646 RepID=UPI00403A9C2D
MNALKRLIFVPMLALMACAPPKMQAPAMPGMIPNEAAPLKTPGPGTNEKVAAIVTDGKINPGKSLGTSATPPSSWELSGAMAAKNKNKAWSASVNWIQRGISSYQIRLFGPLGSGTVMISRQGGAISFRDGPKSVTSSNADELLSRQTGVRLPVSNLFYWVRGIPAPGAVQSAQRDANGHLTLLRQSGYTIQYLGYSSVGKMALPASIRLQGNGVFIKMVIKRWRI